MALAPAVAGEHRYTNPLGLPWRPRKFRLDVERLTSPGPTRPKLPPMHGPQHGDSTVAPASMNFSTSPALRTFKYSALLAGTTIILTPLATGSPLIKSLASNMSSNLPLVQDPKKI